MDSQGSLPSKATPKQAKKKYCDRSFKRQLSKALKMNAGEPGHIKRIMGNRMLQEYDTEKVISFTNNAAANVQQHANSSITAPRLKELVTVAQVMDHISFGVKPQELPLVMKLHSNNDHNLAHPEAQGVQFDQLNKFLHAAINGSVDYTDMNEPTKKILYDTFNMLMEQVEKDAPNCLEELKSRLGTGYAEEPRQNIEELSQMFQDKTLNPLSIPFEYLLNGTIPE